jgi:flagellar basal body-associated protein FliL
MKKGLVLLMVLMILFICGAEAQCAMCTKTAAQLGEKPALGLNKGILYLMAAPFVIMGVIGYRWWKNEKANY